MQENIARNTNIKNGLVMKRNSAQAKLDAAVKNAENNLNTQRQTEDRIRILTEMEINMDGFQQSVRQVLTKGKEGSLGGILGSVAQLISVEKAITPPVTMGN